MVESVCCIRLPLLLLLLSTSWLMWRANAAAARYKAPPAYERTQSEIERENTLAFGSRLSVLGSLGSHTNLGQQPQWQRLTNAPSSTWPDQSRTGRLKVRGWPGIRKQKESQPASKQLERTLCLRGANQLPRCSRPLLLQPACCMLTAAAAANLTHKTRFEVQRTQASSQSRNNNYDQRWNLDCCC